MTNELKMLWIVWQPQWIASITMIALTFWVFDGLELDLLLPLALASGLVGFITATFIRIAATIND